MTEAEITTQPFRLSLREHMGFLLRVYYHGLVAWPAVIIYVLQIVAVPLLVNLSEVTQGRFSGFLIGMGIMLLIWCVAMPAFGLARTAWNYPRNPLMSTLHSVRLNDRGLTVEGPALFSELTWGNLRKAERGKAHLYVFMSAATAYVIPDSAFASREAADDFLDRARRLIKQSKHSQAAVFEAPVMPTPDQAQLQSQPFVYDFGLHFQLYPGLLRRAITPVFITIMVVLWGVMLSQHGWGLTEGDRADMLPEILGMPVLFGALLLILPLIVTPLTWLRVRKQAGTRGPRVAALSEDRLVVHGAAFHTELRLAELTRVRRTRKLMLFMTQPNCAIVVPNAAFETPEAAKVFFDEASARWQAARPKPAAKTHLDGKS